MGSSAAQDDDAMDSLQFIYFADPMCSWCWGFSPVIEQIAARYGDAVPVRLVMGGLRPGTAEPMSTEARATLCGHWREVEEASGQPFDYGLTGRDGFIYDTDPAARATVVVRREAPDKALAFLSRVQRAFYAENRDVTSAEVLEDLVAEFGVSREGFADKLASEAVKQETWGDYAVSQRAGVRGFPTLIAGPGPDGTYAAVTRGFQPAEAILPMVHQWLTTVRAA
jgi:putative protein-disulfide isomerase